MASDTTRSPAFRCRQTCLGVGLAALCQVGVAAQESTPAQLERALRMEARLAAEGLDAASTHHHPERLRRLRQAVAMCQLWHIELDPAIEALLDPRPKIADRPGTTAVDPAPSTPATQPPVQAPATLPPQGVPGPSIAIGIAYRHVLDDTDPRIGAFWAADDGPRLSGTLEIGSADDWGISTTTTFSQRATDLQLEATVDDWVVGGALRWSEQATAGSDPRESISAFARYSLFDDQTSQHEALLQCGARYEHSDEPLLWRDGHDDASTAILDTDASSQRLGLEIVARTRQQHTWCNLAVMVGSAQHDTGPEASAALAEAGYAQRLSRQGFWSADLSAGVHVQSHWARLSAGYHISAEGPVPPFGDTDGHASAIHTRIAHGPMFGLLATF